MDGLSEGRSVGVAVGSPDGEGVGPADGLSEGEGVGSADGLFDGDADGSSLGSADGDMDGSAEGDTVGSSVVGCAVVVVVSDTLHSAFLVLVHSLSFHCPEVFKRAQSSLSGFPEAQLV